MAGCFKWVGTSLFFSAWLCAGLVQADTITPDESGDFLDMSLEEILETKIDPNLSSVLEIHTHNAGEWMLGYQVMLMGMEGNRSGKNRISNGEVLGDYAVTPISMSMEMHMASVMYSYSDDLTLMAMVPLVRASMNHTTRMGKQFTTKVSGISDVMLMANYMIWRGSTQRVIVHAGGSIPTGSIDQRDDTPAGSNQKLPYPMQLGSGTFDVMPGLGYLLILRDWAMLANLHPVIRLGENRNGYRLGHRAKTTTLVVRKWTNWFSTNLGLTGHYWGNIAGRDSDLNPTMVPTADADLRSGRRIDFIFGFDLFAHSGILKGLNLGLTAGLPVYQSLRGPQLEQDWSLNAGVQWTR